MRTWEWGQGVSERGGCKKGMRMRPAIWSPTGLLFFQVPPIFILQQALEQMIEHNNNSTIGKYWSWVSFIRMWCYHE